MKVVELFAGFGGGGEGARQAGAEVIWGSNHWPLAVAHYSLNHPGTQTVCQDMRQYNMGLIPDHDLAITTPCCQGHSRGRKRNDPAHDASRGTAWSVIDLLEAKRPEVCLVENVPEFQRWALFPAWKAAVEALRYSVSVNVVDCARLGLPQHRVRLVLVLTRSATPLTLKLPSVPLVSVRQVIRWDSYSWSLVHKVGRSPKTLDRWARGRAAQGDCFVMPYYSKGSGLTGRSLDRPLGTLTTRARWAVVKGDLMRMLHPVEARDVQGFPSHYRLPVNVKLANHLLGNAMPPVLAKEIILAVKAAA